MHRSNRVSGIISLLVLASACYGFAGGGFPSNIRTVAIVPFENETPVSELTQEISDELRDAMKDRLGLRDASEDRAHAIVRGTITRYEADVPVGFSADPTQATSARRRVQITMDIEITEQATGRTLWKRAGLSADGEYAERQEAEGRQQAIERLVNEVVEGAQSQW